MDENSYDCFDLEAAVREIAAAAGAPQRGVRAAISLLQEGNTLPFIARYRKEATGGLDETQLRAIEDGLARARDLADRKATVLKTIDGQGLLTAELRRTIEACEDRQTLEDLYLPFKPKRRSRATIARERGLQPLADLLLAQQPLGTSRNELLRRYVDPANDLPDTEAVLRGALDIVAEQWSEDVDARRWLTDQARGFGRIRSKVKRGKASEAAKFEMYLDHSEPWKRVPSHRLLAMKRGEAEGLLNVGIELDDEFVLRKLRQRFLHAPGEFPFDGELREAVDDCYRRLLLPSIESVVLREAKERADAEAIGVFASNLRELLLAAPAGPRVTMGIDPGFRTGCKVAVVDGTGRFVESRTIYPTPPKNDVESAGRAVRELVERHGVELIAIGNGTASRETDAFVRDVLRELPEETRPTKVMVSESGASIYSASELATREYPDLDVTVRGAISIAHRLQDPLAELVKLDPKSIGVGQYQHDVDQTQLRSALDREVESCVNSVGVDVNTASGALLSHVAGIGPRVAERIVAHRDERGRFDDRRQLLDVPKLGPKAFEQSAGFLRIRDGARSLDASAVHPERYEVVERMAASLDVDCEQLVGNATLVARIEPGAFVVEDCGRATVDDILAELAKPGRDPRSEFRVAEFAEGVDRPEDLRPGMLLEGVVTNVTKFGAFIDIGVHQDALIHVSELADRFVSDPGEIVSIGDVVRVKVLNVDLERRRIGVSRKQAMGDAMSPKPSS